MLREALYVEGSVLEYVLYNCINLERLTVWVCRFYSASRITKLLADVADGDDKLVALISLIEACPLLHTFKLEVYVAYYLFSFVFVCCEYISKTLALNWFCSYSVGLSQERRCLL